ncbi:tetratricopeptide repeat protein [Streptomyces sp. NBC_01431]|uniref:tetratricopeptide repeat protein n=1 Tax=Streptomyces sp. NBC_01431 TaxID=2903863 RepID=UPI002E2FDE7D|nr:tetratricopeptide repeat protein [Streptomyces sp. NBC_01431]
MAGDAAGAAAAFEQILADRQRVLGPDHPNTLTARKDLAVLHGLTGDSADAARALAELLADCERVLGPDHPNTLAVRSHLARLRGRAGGDAVDLSTG